MSNLSAKLAELADELVATGGTLGRADVAGAMRERHPELVMREADSLIDRQIWKEFRNICRGSDDEQYELPGLSFPKVIDVPGPDGPRLMNVLFARWGQLQAARELRRLNVDRADAKLRRFDVALEQVRNLMEENSSMRLCDAMEALGISVETEAA